MFRPAARGTTPLARAVALACGLLGCASASAPAPAPARAAPAVEPAPEEVLAAPLEAALLVAPAPLLASMRARLAGQRTRLGDGVLLIEDIAGLGRPWVGVVQARCEQLWLVTALGPLRLTGPLARPRLAGPGYLVWALGRRQGPALSLARLGVLARPDEVSAAHLAAPPSIPCADRAPTAPRTYARPRPGA